jgi:hypothetical protein
MGRPSGPDRHGTKAFVCLILEVPKFIRSATYCSSSKSAPASIRLTASGVRGLPAGALPKPLCRSWGCSIEADFLGSVGSHLCKGRSCAKNPLRGWRPWKQDCKAKLQRLFIEPPKAKFSTENLVTILILFFHSFKEPKMGHPSVWSRVGERFRAGLVARRFLAQLRVQRSIVGSPRLLPRAPLPQDDTGIRSAENSRSVSFPRALARFRDGIARLPLETVYASGP